ncbi:CotH kinase family protein [Limosilactobacillus reuteri]|uniref:CotH kinase family protein n=1 Tax=Limosilactobacillus reuteri TaxID=1598 RepID=UPI00143D9AE9|nr:CotH kinase family protein [Limosilactobacillus reuteri]QIZ04197.1 hypothetical protein GXL24_04115 [Limosilactobacillus reuteri]
MQAQSVILDLLKPVGTIVDLSDKFNARVGDSMTPFNLFITEGGKPKALNGLHPELEAVVGNGALKGNKAIMNAGAKGVHWVGSTNNVTGYNQLTLALPAEVFPQSGFCYGHLILANEADVRESSADIWFQVLDGTPLMGLVADHYDSELQLELAKAKNANDQFSQEMRDTYNQQVTDAQNALTRASSDLSHLAISVGQVQSQIDAGNVITRAEFKELDDRISAKLSTMRINPEAFENEAALRAKYPQGNDQLNVTIDNGHLWVWIDGDFKDCGPFQTAGIDQKLVDQIKEALAFANGDNFIANGSFTTGNVEPAMTTNDDTKLAITDYLGQKWLQITAVGNSSMRGAQWVIDRADKITAIQNYPLNINFDIQSSVAQTFNIDIHFFNNNGQDMNNAINIDQLSLNPWELLHYNKTIDLDISSLAGVAKIAIMVYSNNTGEYGTVLITKLKINVKYNTNALPGASLLPKEPWTANNNSRITTTTHLGEEWHSLTTSVAGTGQGYQWVIDDTAKISLLPYYPLRLSFNINSLTVSQLFNIDVHFYDKNGNDLNNSYTIDSLQADAGSFIHYEKQVTFDFNHLQNATKISLMLYSTNAEDVGTVLLNHESALLQFKTNQLKGPELIDGQPFPNNGETVISTTKYLEQEWLQMTSTANTQFRGLQWQIDNKDKIFLMATYPVKFQFNIQSSIAQTFNLDLHFYDKNGNDLGNSINIDKISLNAWELFNYQKRYLVDYNHINNAAKVVLMLYTPGTEDLGTVLINDYSAVLEYNTNEDTIKNTIKPSSSDYKGLPEVYLNGSTSSMSGTNYVTMQFTFKDNGREVDGFASTKWQGDSSLAFDKKAYRIKTFEDQRLTKKMKFKPNPLWDPDNKYNLKAYYTDPLLCRDVVNANIGTDIWSTQKNMPDDLVETDDFGFVDGFPVKVFINDKFAGIYSFNTAKGDYGKHAKAVISGETYTDPTAFSNLPAGGVKLDGSDFEMISPDEPTDEIKQATNDLITFVSTSSDEDFKAQLSQHIDLESLIDYFIFLNVIENGDAAGKNQTLITWDLKKWYFHPYDLDTTFGVDSNGKISEPSTGLLGLNSHLFTRLNALFSDQIKARYKELRTWLTPVYVLKMYRDHINLIGESNYEDEFKLWDNPNHDKNTYNFLKTHIYKRFRLLDSIWN